MDDRGIGSTLVVAEPEASKSVETLRRVITAAHRLEPAFSQRAMVLLPGPFSHETVAEASESGVQRVYRFDHSLLWIHPQEIVLTGLLQLLEKASFKTILFSASDWGVEMAARTAARLGVGLMHNLIDIEADPQSGALVGVSAGMQRGLLCRQEFKGSVPSVATINADAFRESRGMAGRAEIVALHVNPNSESFRITKNGAFPLPPDREPPLEGAEVVVAGGKGIGGKAGFSRLRELALLLNGATGCTLPPVEAGWMERDAMIGATGKRVHPKWYLGFGISGDDYHTSGMADSENIVVVNNDEKAPFFHMADYGIVGDLHEILPLLIDRLQEEEERQG